MRTDRSFIGIEADPEYYELAVNRINEASATVKDNGFSIRKATVNGLERWGLDA